MSQLACPCWRLIRLTWFSDKRQRGRGNRTAQTAGPLAGRWRLSRHGSKAERRRWDGSETALREAKSALRGAGPSTGPMLRSQSPGLVRQELAAWAAATEMTRGVARDAALAGQPVQPREIPFTAARRAVIAAIRSGRTGYTTLTSALARLRTVIDRNRHRARKAKCPSTFEHARRADTATRTAQAVITLANKPA